MVGDNTERQIRRMLTGQRVGVLATSQEGSPHVCLIAFAATPDLSRIVFATSRSTRKYANIIRDAGVTLLVDDRANREEDFHRAAAVTAHGTAREIAGEGEGERRLFLEKHPYLGDFVASPTCALFEIQVQRYFLVSRFQNVVEFKVPR